MFHYINFFDCFRRYHSALGLNNGQHHQSINNNNNNNLRRSINQSFNSNVKFGAKNFGLKYQDSKIQDGGFKIQDGGSKIQEDRSKMQSVGYKIQDGGYKIQDGGYKIQDSGYKIQDGGPTSMPSFRQRILDSRLSGKILPSKSGIVEYSVGNLFRF